MFLLQGLLPIALGNPVNLKKFLFPKPLLLPAPGRYSGDIATDGRQGTWPRFVTDPLHPFSHPLK